MQHAKKKTGKLSPVFIFFPRGGAHRRRRIEIKAPIIPTIPKNEMIRPIGSVLDESTGGSLVYVGITSGGGAVKVGRRVGAASTTNWAARVGSMVGVIMGVGVGGGSTKGSSTSWVRLTNRE